MTRPAEIRGAPHTHVAAGEWPDGRLSAVIPARYAQVLARNLRSTIGSQNLTQEEVCRRTGLDRSTLWAILAGKRWPDIVSISKLEWGLGRRLWPLEEILLLEHRPPTEAPPDNRRKAALSANELARTSAALEEQLSESRPSSGVKGPSPIA